MNALQIAKFRARHRFLKSRDGVRCKCGWRPPADAAAVDIARIALGHLQVEKLLIEQPVMSS